MKALVKIAITMALVCCLSGCGSSLMISDEKPAASEETVDAAKEKTPEELAAQYYKDAEKAEIKKYNTISGKRAFYLLPAGVPWPGGIVSFQLLDVLNDNTTVYAYQTLYALKDTSGLGGQPDSGRKTENETVGENFIPFIPDFAREITKEPTKIKGPADKADKLATLIMAYNFETEEYRVLFHDLQNVSVDYIFDGESVTVNIQNELSENSYGTLDLSAFKAVRISEGKYAFCYKDHLYRIGVDGTVESNVSLAQDIRYLMTTQKNNSAGVWHVEQLAADADGNNSLLLQYVNEETIDGYYPGAPDQKDSSIMQFLLSSDKDDGEQIFQTDNLSYQQQVDSYLEYDGETIDLGLLLTEPDEEDILDYIGSKEDILKIFPDNYNSYYRNAGSRQYQMYTESESGIKKYPDGRSVLNPDDEWHVSVEERIGSDKAYADAYVGSLSSSIQVIDETFGYTREVEVEYQTQHEELITDSEGNIQLIIVTDEHSMTYEDSAEFRERCWAKLPVTGLKWYWNVPCDREITESPYEGITSWYSADPDYEMDGSTGKSDVRWDVYGSPFFKTDRKETGKTGISFNDPLKLVDMQRESFDGLGSRIPVLYLSGPDNVSVYYNFNKTPGSADSQWADSLQIPKKKLSYTQRMDDDGELALDFSEDALHLRKENGRPVLYAASMGEGLTRLPLKKDGSSSGMSDQGLVSLVGQIVDFPCLKLVIPEKKNMLYAFGFDGIERGFSETDFPFCCIYKVNPFSEKYCSNLITSVLDNPENFAYKWKLLNLPTDKGSAGEWNKLYDCLGIGTSADKAVLEKTRTQILTRWGSVMRFIRLAKLENIQDKGSMVREIEKSRTVEELESVFVNYTDIKVDEEKIPEPKDTVEAGEWKTNIRFAKLRAIRDLQNPKMTDNEWSSALNEILYGMGNKAETDDK